MYTWEGFSVMFCRVCVLCNVVYVLRRGGGKTEIFLLETDRKMRSGEGETGEKKQWVAGRVWVKG